MAFPDAGTAVHRVPPPPPPPPTTDAGRRLDDAQVRQLAGEVLDVGDRTLWRDDYDARLDRFAEVAGGLDADSASRLFDEVLAQDSGAFGSWLQLDRIDALAGSGRITADERAALADAFAGAYVDGALRAPDVQRFLGVATDRAPAFTAAEFTRARDFLDAGGAPVQAFREAFARDTFLDTAARAQSGYGPTSMQSALAVNLLADGSGGAASVAQVFRALSPEQQRAVAAELGFAAEGYANSASAIEGLRAPLDTLTQGLTAGEPVPTTTDADGTINITVTYDPADTPAERQVLLNVADGLAGIAHPSPAVQSALTELHREVDTGVATQRDADPAYVPQSLARVQDAQARAQAVFAALPANASREQVWTAVDRNLDAVAAPTFAQYLELRGDTARPLAGPALRNDIGLAMGLQPNNAPLSPAQEQALARGEWDFFSGAETSAIRAVEAQITSVGGTDARVAALPVTVASEQIGGVVQVPLFRVERADGQVRYVDYNPATGESRSYSSFQDWRENNRLPPGRMSFPQDGHLTAGADGRPRVVTENTPGTPDTFWERWGQPVLDGAAMVGGVVLLGAVVVGSGGTALVVGGALLGAYGAYRGGEVIVDRATHGQTVNPLESAEARNAWLNVGAGVVGLAAAGATLRAASAAGRAASGLDDAANLVALANQARGLNVAAQYADTAAFVDTGYTLAANWDRMTPQQQLSALAQMAFWAGGTGVAARQSGGLSNLYGVGDLAQGMRSANDWIRTQLPDGAQVDRILTQVTDGIRNGLQPGFEIRALQTPDGTTVYAIVARGSGSSSPTPRVPVDSSGNPVRPAPSPQQDFGAGLLPFREGQRQVDGNGRTVVDVVQGTTGHWNRDLTVGRGAGRGFGDVFEANVTYRTPEGYLFHTDANGRIEQVQGSLQLDTGHPRSPSQQTAVVDRYGVNTRSGATDPDQGGHWIARIFRGPGEGMNITPMLRSINNGSWGRMEDFFAAQLRAGNRVEVDIVGFYPDPTTTPPPAHPDRPDYILVDYWVSDPSGRQIASDSLTYDNRRP